jgi:hypothetical protein
MGYQILKLLSSKWTWIAVGVGCLVLLWQYDRTAHGNARAREAVAPWVAADIAAKARAATREAADRALKARQDKQYADDKTDLEKRLAAALSRPPAVRIVRVPYPAPAGNDVPAATGDAHGAQGGGADGGPARAGEADYRELRDEILRLGADAERLRLAVRDAREAWPE